MISILLMEEIRASPGMVKTPINNGIIIILGGAGFQPSTVGSMYDLFASPLGMGATEFFLASFLSKSFGGVLTLTKMNIQVVATQRCFVEFLPRPTDLPGEMIQFDGRAYFSNGWETTN